MFTWYCSIKRCCALTETAFETIRLPVVCFSWSIIETILIWLRKSGNLANIWELPKTIYGRRIQYRPIQSLELLPFSLSHRWRRYCVAIRNITNTAAIACPFPFVILSVWQKAMNKHLTVDVSDGGACFTAEKWGKGYGTPCPKSSKASA